MSMVEQIDEVFCCSGEWKSLFEFALIKQGAIQASGLWLQWWDAESPYPGCSSGPAVSLAQEEGWVAGCLSLFPPSLALSSSDNSYNQGGMQRAFLSLIMSIICIRKMIEEWCSWGKRLSSFINTKYEEWHTYYLSFCIGCKLPTIPRKLLSWRFLWAKPSIIYGASIVGRSVMLTQIFIVASLPVHGLCFCFLYVWGGCINAARWTILSCSLFLKWVSTGKEG